MLPSSFAEAPPPASKGHWPSVTHVASGPLEGLMRIEPPTWAFIAIEILASNCVFPIASHSRKPTSFNRTGTGKMPIGTVTQMPGGPTRGVRKIFVRTFVSPLIEIDELQSSDP